MKIAQMEPLVIPPSITDMFVNLLFVFIVMTCILAAGALGMREVRLALPEVDKGIAEELKGPGDGAEVIIRRAGGITVNGKAIGAARELEKLVNPGQTVAIILEKGTTADALIAVEGYLKKAGVREVTVLVKEAI